MAIIKSAKRALRRIQKLPTTSYRMIKMMRWHVGRRIRLRRRQQRNRDQVPEQIPAAAAGEADVPAENVVEEEPVVEVVMPEAPLYDRVLILGPGGLSVDFPGELTYLAEQLTPLIHIAMLVTHIHLSQQ